MFAENEDVLVDLQTGAITFIICGEGGESNIELEAVSPGDEFEPCERDVSEKPRGYIPFKYRQAERLKNQTNPWA